MSNISKQLSRLDLSKVKMKNGRTVVDELKYHAAILADCIMNELDEVYESYTPKLYNRSYDLYNSLYIDEGVKIDISNNGAGISIGIHFDENAIHKSFDGSNSDVATLLNEGWNWKNSVSIPYLSERSGTFFIDKGIEKYKKKVNNPFKVRLTINDKERTF